MPSCLTMGWLEVLIGFLAVSCFGFSWKAFLTFALCIGSGFWLTKTFLRSRWDVDWYFEKLFQAFEHFGCGTPHRLDRMPLASFTDGYTMLDEIPRPLEESIRRLIDNIVRDFILVWYDDVAKGESFVDECRRLLEILSVEVYRRSSQIDTHYLIEQVVLTYHAHLDRFNKSLSVVKTRDPKLRLKISPTQLLFQTYESQLPSRHPALTGPAQELSYLRSIVNSLLLALVPKDSFSCDAGFFILREILAVEVLQPLVSKLLTDPDWINEVITDLATPNLIPESDEGEKQVLDSGTGQADAEVNFSAGEVNEDTKKTGSISCEPGSHSVSKETEMSSLDTEDGKSEGPQNQDLPPLTKVNFYGHTPAGEEDRAQTESFLVISMENSNQENGHKLEHLASQAWSTEVNPPSSLEELSRSSSLTSSWHVCPSPQNNTFKSESFERMKSRLTQQGLNSRDHGSSLGDLTQNIKTLACCGYDDKDSGDTNTNHSKNGYDVAPCSAGNSSQRLRSKSISLPQLDGQQSDGESSQKPHDRIKRSISVPCNLQSKAKLPESDPSNESPDRPRSTNSQRHRAGFLGSPFYSVSLYSSSESFKSVSTDDEKDSTEEATEAYDDEDCNVVRDTFGMLFQASAERHLGYSHQRKRPSITKQARFEESSGQEVYLDFPLCESSSTARDQRSWSVDSRDRRKSQETCGLEDIKELSAEFQVSSDKIVSGVLPKDKDSGSDDSFFAESILSAGRKFVSNFKPPFMSNSSGSTKSSEVSVSSEASGSLSTSQDNQGTGKAVPGLQVRSGPSQRRFSRSDALTVQSLESDIETFYGSAEDAYPTREEIVYGTEGGDGPAGNVVKIHPSKLITIPSTEMANENVWEPGRSKYTLYLIEYDIRIWPEVYEAALEESRDHEPGVGDMSEEGKSFQEQDALPAGALFVKRTIKRRYREFMELHHRLCTGIHKEDMKDILKPNRKYSLHFTRLDPGVVEGRRTLLEYYIVSLVSKPALRNSNEVRQFLGVAGGELVSFVRPSVVQVPRVDKILSRQVTKVFDSIKTAFDSEDDQLSQAQSQTRWWMDDELPWRTELFSPKVLGMESPYLLQEECCEVFITEQEYLLTQVPTQAEETNPPGEGFDAVDGFMNRVKAAKKKLKHFGREKVHLTLGPQTASDGCETPESPSFASDDMLYWSPTQGDVPSRIVQLGSAKPLKKPLLGAISLPANKSESLDSIPGATEAYDAHRSLGRNATPAGLTKSESFNDITTGISQKETVNPRHTQEHKSATIAPQEPQVAASQERSELEGSSTTDGIPSQLDMQYPLASAILSLICEVLKGRSSWASIDRVQGVFLSGVGGLFEWSLLRAVDDVATDEGWAFALDKLNEAIWPNGKLREEDTSVKSDEEKAEAKRKAAQALSDVLPGVCRVLVGPKVYDEASVGLVESLQHPQVNRILLFQLLELVLSQLLPEFPAEAI